MVRIAMNLPDELLKEFDEVLKENGYTSRRNGLRDAINEYIVRFQRKCKIKM